MMGRPTTQAVLDTLTRQGVLPHTARAELEEVLANAGAAHVPWFVRLLVGASAWIAASLFLIFLANVALLGSGVIAIIGGLGCVAAAVRLRQRCTHDFWVQFALAGSIAGLMLSVSGVVMSTDSSAVVAAFMLFLATAMLRLYPDQVVHLIAAVAIPGALLVLLLPARALPARVDFLVVATMVAGAALWLAPPKWELHRFGDRRRPVAFGWLLFAQGLLAADAFAGLGEEPSRWLLRFPTAAGLGLWCLLCFVRVSRSCKVRLYSVPSLVAWVLIGVVCVLTWRTPGVVASLLLLMLAFHRSSSVLFGIASLSLIGFVGLFYFSLSTTLLAKSGMLLGAGMTLLGLRFYLKRCWRTRCWSRLTEQKP